MKTEAGIKRQGAQNDKRPDESALLRVKARNDEMPELHRIYGVAKTRANSPATFTFCHSASAGARKTNGTVGRSVGIPGEGSGHEHVL